MIYLKQSKCEITMYKVENHMLVPKGTVYQSFINDILQLEMFLKISEMVVFVNIIHFTFSKCI